jgi:hypothetical protein
MYEMCVCYIIKRGVDFLLSRLFFSIPISSLRMLGQMHLFFSLFYFLSRRRRLQQQGKHGGRWSARVRLCPFIQERWHTRTLSAQ